MAIPSFSHPHLRQIANTLADAVSHKELPDILKECHISEQGGEPRWEKILFALQEKQRVDQCGNNVAVFMETVLNPVRFTSRHQDFEDTRYKINVGLALCGLSLGENGKIKAISQATSLTEARIEPIVCKRN